MGIHSKTIHAVMWLTIPIPSKKPECEYSLVKQHDHVCKDKRIFWIGNVIDDRERRVGQGGSDEYERKE